MISQVTKNVSSAVPTISYTLSKLTSNTMKKTLSNQSNSFKSFQEYRKLSKTYGPLSAKTAKSHN